MAPGREGVVLPVCGRKDDGSDGEYGRQLRSRLPGRAVSDSPAATGFRSGLLLLRCERRRAEIPDCHESGRGQCRPALRVSKLGLRNGEVVEARVAPSVGVYPDRVGEGPVFNSSSSFPSFSKFRFPAASTSPLNSSPSPTSTAVELISCKKPGSFWRKVLFSQRIA